MPADAATTPAGVPDAIRVAWLAHGAEYCGLGWHAWVPWLRLDNGSWLTWCAREGCDHSEQYDIPGDPS